MSKKLDLIKDGEPSRPPALAGGLQAVQTQGSWGHAVSSHLCGKMCGSQEGGKVDCGGTSFGGSLMMVCSMKDTMFPDPLPKCPHQIWISDRVSGTSRGPEASFILT